MQFLPRPLLRAGRKSGLITGLFLLTCCSQKQSVQHREPLPHAEQEAHERWVFSLIGTNDLHGHIESLPWFGGYVANVRAARARDGAMLLLDAGDMFQGTMASNLSEGGAVVQAYNALAYTAVALGNHEFDFGPAGPAMQTRREGEDPRGAIKARARESLFPLLTANILHVEQRTPLHGENILPTALVAERGVKIGIVGVSTAETARSTLAENFVGLTVAPLAETVTQHATALVRQGADLVIVVAHAGAACASFERPQDLSSCTVDAEIFDLAQALPRGTIAAIIAGHTHAGVAHEVAGIPIIESYSYGRAFGRIDLFIDSTTRRVVQHKIFAPHDICLDKVRCATERYEGQIVAATPEVSRVVAVALQRVQERAEAPLGARAIAPIKRAYRQESPLGNLFTDLMRAARPAADVAATNGGGLRKDLPAGDLQYRHLYEASPFDNTFAAARVSGAALRNIVSRNLQSGGGFLSLSGLEVRASCEGRALRVQLYRPSGQPVADEETLLLVTTNFLATGGDGLFSGLSFEVEPAPPVRDEMAEVLRNKAPILSPGTLFNPQRPRVSYPGSRPVQCR